MNNSYNHYTVRTGRYDLLHPDEYQQNFTFYLREDSPFELQVISFVVTDVEEKFDTVYDCAVALQYRINQYLVNSDKKRIDILVNYLEKYLYEDKLAELRYTREKLLTQLNGVNARISSVTDEYNQYLENLG